MTKPRYHRILLKISGEALAGTQGYGIAPDVIERLTDQLQEVHALGIQLGIVIGGGNIFRGLEATTAGMERAHADYMGMLATLLNALALQHALEKRGVFTRVQSAIEMQELAEPYIRRRAIRHLEKGRAVIFAGGTGNPYFSTDTAAALRGMEIGAEVILKGTRVDGIFDHDPLVVAGAKQFDSITFRQVLERGLKVMDSTAITLCMDNHLPIVIFNITGKDNLVRLVMGEKIGTLVS